MADALIGAAANDDVKHAVCSALISSLQRRGWDTEGESLGLYVDDAAIKAAFAENGITVKCHVENDTEPWVCEEDEGHDEDRRDYVGRTWSS